jgi:hypothetical protein
VLAEPPADAGTQAGGTFARFGLGHPTTGPFPSNWFTVPDDTQLTDLRVNLPYPDCTVYVSDCNNLNNINQLDGFNPQPRLSVPFSGSIDLSTVHSDTVFLVSLGSTTEDEGFMPRGYGVGINQIVWDVETNALHVESDELLAQHTRFALFVTTGVRDAQGDPVRASPTFTRFLHRGQGEYHDWLLDAMAMAEAYGLQESNIATASVFTTLSTTSYLEKVRDQIKAETPKPAEFLLGEKGERSVFNRSDVTGITFNQQVRVNPPEFTQSQLNLALLDLVPGAVGRLAFGKYLSPEYRLSDGTIPTIPTRTGVPAVQEMKEIYFNVTLPSGPMPSGGWPVAILGHGSGNHRSGYQLILAASLAERGVASIIINQPGFGYGPLSTLVVNQTAGGPVTFLEGGRGRDANGDGMIGANEGGGAVARQFTADLMQLVRVIQVGMDVDGDTVVDLNPARVSYAGNSLGGINGIQFVAIEPDLRAAVLTVTAGGGAENTGRLSSVNRDGNGSTLAARTPSLINAPGVTFLDGVAITVPYFHENLPLRNGLLLNVTLADGTNAVIQSPVINTVPGALAIQEWMDNSQWIGSTTATPAYAPYLRRAPLPGVPAKPVIFQFGKGDYTQPNPGTTAILRAGDLADRTLYYRNDLAFAEDPTVSKSPHGMMTNINHTNPLVRSIARGAQQQIAAFFASDGQSVIHPEPARFFEVPIKGPLPEELNYIP